MKKKILISSIIGAFAVGGIIAGVTIHNHNETDENESSVISEITDKSEAISEDNSEAISEDNSENEIEELSADYLLSIYFNDFYNGEPEIYNPAQTLNIKDKMSQYDVTSYSYTYDEATQQLNEEISLIYDEGYATLDYLYNYAGIYYADVDDYNNDGELDLLVIDNYNTNAPDSIEVVIFDYNFDYGLEEISYGELSINYRDIKDKVSDYDRYFYYQTDIVKEIDDIYITTIDGKKYLTILNNNSINITQEISCALISLEDLSCVSYLHFLAFSDEPCDIVEVKNGNVNEEIYSIDDEQYMFIPTDDFLIERGYLNETSEHLFSSYGGVLNDFQRKYLFNNGAYLDTNNTDNSDTEISNLISQLSNGELIYFTGVSYSYSINFESDSRIIFNKSGFERTEHPVFYDAEATADIIDLKKRNDYSYSFTIENAVDTYEPHEEEKEVEWYGQMTMGTYKYSEIADTVNGTYIICLPNTPVTELDKVWTIYSSDYRIDDYDNEFVNGGRTTKYIVYKVGENFAYVLTENNEEN